VRKRAELVRHFQEDETVPFFVLSLKACGPGLNLTAAAYVVHFDRWWNPAVENQATDRAFRIGQTKNRLPRERGRSVGNLARRRSRKRRGKKE
jgi:non-specific serine/threonine protein kinase